MGYSVELLLDSVNARGVRLTTWELNYPRMVHAELMTHRDFSRNSASSRAIPPERLLRDIESDPVLPRWWGKNQPGMQAREELSGTALEMSKMTWLQGRDHAVALSREMSRHGLHKQIVNRVVEPWMFITVIMSTTQHENWLEQRNHADAQPEIAWVAAEMHGRLRASQPTFIPTGGWHRPYMRDIHDLRKVYSPRSLNLISAGRCAAVSYLNHGEGVDPEKDLARAEKLLAAHPSHRSPFEHVASSRNDEVRRGNFTGWLQYRKLIPSEAGPAEQRLPPAQMTTLEKIGHFCPECELSPYGEMRNLDCKICSGTGYADWEQDRE